LMLGAASTLDSRVEVTRAACCWEVGQGGRVRKRKEQPKLRWEWHGRNHGQACDLLLSPVPETRLLRSFRAMHERRLRALTATPP
jgi:hypothetical protein